MRNSQHAGLKRLGGLARRNRRPTRSSTAVASRTGRRAGKRPRPHSGSRAPGLFQPHSCHATWSRRPVPEGGAEPVDGHAGAQLRQRIGHRILIEKPPALRPGNTASLPASRGSSAKIASARSDNGTCAPSRPSCARRERPDALGLIDLGPAGEAHFAGPRSRQDQELQGPRREARHRSSSIKVGSSTKGSATWFRVEDLDPGVAVFESPATPRDCRPGAVLPSRTPGSASIRSRSRAPHAASSPRSRPDRGRCGRTASMR